MNISTGLASYEIYKTGIALFFQIFFLCIAIGITIYNIGQNYQVTSICNITTNPDMSQIINYTVDKVQYVKNAPPVTTTNSKTNITSTNPAHQTGSCSIYYPKSNPDSFNVNVNPLTISGLFAGGLFILVILTYLWFNFMNNNKDIAAVAGGVSIIDSLTRRR
jgi:hypothetical protein